MLRPFGPGLPSDAIAHRYGFEGNEPKETELLHAKYASIGVRSTFAVNTFYPEIEGGYFVNRALFVLIDHAMRQSGVFPVLLELWREEGLVPMEGEGHFIVQEAYTLVAMDRKQKGVLQIWQFNTGGGGHYYSDNIIFDLVLPQALTRQTVDKVEARCRAESVRFCREANTGAISDFRR